MAGAPRGSRWLEKDLNFMNPKLMVALR